MEKPFAVFTAEAFSLLRLSSLLCYYFYERKGALKRALPRKNNSFMREIGFKEISSAVSSAIGECCYHLGDYAKCNIKKALESEKDELAREVLRQIDDNVLAAEEDNTPICQDTGIAVIFAEIGRDVHFTCDFYEAVNAGVKEAYDKFYLRKSVADPLTRINTKDNTPAVVHITLTSGDKIRLKIAPKGAGSENMSKVAMLNPSDGKEGIKKFVVDTVKVAGGRPCPPLYIGVGIGGDLDKCCILAKEALLRSDLSVDPALRELEREIKEELNKTNIGPMGLGGETTCFDVFINTFPCHIASLPVAVNIQCHANRHIEVEI